MELKQGFSDMENSTVFDIENREIGKIVDHYFTNDFRLEYFVIESELGKRMLLHKNDITGRENERVYISKERSELIPEDQEINALKGCHRFTIHRDKPVYSVDGHEIGKIEDNIFHADDHISFVVGKHGFRDILTKIGLKQELQIIVPYTYVLDISLSGLRITETKDFVEMRAPYARIVYEKMSLQKQLGSQIKLDFFRMIR